MASGRPRKLGAARFKGGKIKPPTLEQMIRAQQTAANAEKATVLAQPHRRGDADARLECALGRFVIAHRMDSGCYTAGQHYAKLRRQWLAAMGAPLPDRLSGSGADIDMEVVRRWRADLNDMEDTMLRCGVAGLGWVVAIACDGIDMAIDHPASAMTVAALHALAIVTGDVKPPRY
jgi:hypothetical protein